MQIQAALAGASIQFHLSDQLPGAVETDSKHFLHKFICNNFMDRIFSLESYPLWVRPGEMLLRLIIIWKERVAMALLTVNNKKLKFKTKYTVVGILAACAAGAVGGIHCGTARASSVFPMQQFNVIVLGTPTGNNGRTSVGSFNDSSDIQGSAFINGSVAGSTFAGNSLPAGDSIGLEATGGITSTSVHVNNGAVLIGGTAVSGFSVNSGKSLTQSSSQPATDLANFASTLTSTSDQWASLASTAGTSVQTGNNSMTFNIPTGAGNLVVFNVGSSNFGQNDSIGFNGLGSNQQVIINVSGSSFTEPDAVNFNGNSTIADNVIWNFSDVTGTISLSSGFYGSILAPDATLSSGNTITGNVAVANIQSTGEIDFASPAFTVPLNTVPAGGPLPIPASFGLVGIGSLGLLAGAGMRKRVRM
jgi:choice-of-anchor A domain-containing protein